MRILVTFAVEQEFAPWRRLRKFARLYGSSNPAFQASLGDSDLQVVLTGVGRTAARRSVDAAFTPLPDVCIVAGVAGGLREGQRIADVLAARRVQELSSQRIIESDPALLELAVRAGAISASGFCTSHFVVSDAESKRRMGRMSEAVEMETYHILEAAAQRGVRGIAVRALSDLVDESLPMDFTTIITEQGTINRVRLAASLAKSPRRLPALIRLASNTRRAASSLAEFLNAYVIALSRGNAETAAQSVPAKAVVG